MSRYIILAIGLNVGQTEPLNQFRNTLNCLDWFAKEYSWKQQPQSALFSSKYQGVAKRTLQVRFEIGDKPYVAAVTRLAHILCQDCIAVNVARSDTWELVYGDSHHEVNSATTQEYPIYV